MSSEDGLRRRQLADIRNFAADFKVASDADQKGSL
jgi:hypothetical protein